MSKVKFTRQAQNFEAVKDFYIENAQEIGELCGKLKKKGSGEYAKVYCELINGIWDEDNLGEFKGELYADILEKYLLLTSNAYLIHKYCACHNPYSNHNQTEEEFDNDNLIRAYNNEVMNDNADYSALFYYYVIAMNEITRKSKDNN